MLAVALIGCDSGGGGLPTAPPGPPAAQTRFSATLTMVYTQGTPRDYSLIFDGVEVQRIQAGCFAFACLLVGNASGWVPGSRHVIEVRINAQSPTTINYVVSGATAFTNGAQSTVGQLPERRIGLRAGGSVRYEITLP